MTAAEHRAAAAREHDLADDAFEKITGDDITPPQTMPGDVYETPFGIPYPYGYPYDVVADPESYVAWPRVTDPDEEHVDAAREHREKALRHERAAAALEGKPSPQPLPPPQESFLPAET